MITTQPVASLGAGGRDLEPDEKDLDELDPKPRADPALVKSASMKAAWRLIPIFSALIFWTDLDRTTLANTASALENSINLTQLEYGLAAGGFYVTYVLMQVVCMSCLKEGTSC